MTDTETDQLDESYERFLQQAIDTGCVWGLEGEEGWALCPSTFNEDIDVMPLWSDADDAKVHCVDEWHKYQVLAISLEELLDEWLPGMHEDVLMVGINWDENMEGDEVEPLDLLEDFDQAVSEP